MEVRFLKKTDDIKKLIPLAKEFLKDFQKYDEYFKVKKPTDKDIVLFFKMRLEKNSEKTVIALDGKKIVGYLTFFIKKRLPVYKYQKVGRFTGLFVDKQYRKMGVADSLFSFSKDWLKNKKVSYIYSETSVNNPISIKFHDNRMKRLRIQYILKL